MTVKTIRRWLALSLIGCAALAPLSAGVLAQGSELTLVAPAAPGGGWDQTARAMQGALEASGAASPVQVVNVPGAGGTIGLSQFVGADSASPDKILVSGLIMVGGVLTNRSPVTLDEVAPLARLTGEYEMIAVAASSPITSMDDLVARMKADPAAVTWGGGSAGGTDHMLVGMIAGAIGGDPKRINYVAHSGGGESLASILGGVVTVGVNGVAEFAPQIAAGALRPLAVSSEERLPGHPDVPTLKELGIDVTLLNWRGLVVGAELDEAARARLGAAVETMVKSEAWAEELKARAWIDMYQPEAEFAAFLDAEKGKVEETLRGIGLVD